MPPLSKYGLELLLVGADHLRWSQQLTSKLVAMNLYRAKLLAKVRYQLEDILKALLHISLFSKPQLDF